MMNDEYCPGCNSKIADNYRWCGQCALLHIKNLTAQLAARDARIATLVVSPEAKAARDALLSACERWVDASASTANEIGIDNLIRQYVMAKRA